MDNQLSVFLVGLMVAIMELIACWGDDSERIGWVCVSFFVLIGIILFLAEAAFLILSGCFIFKPLLLVITSFGFIKVLGPVFETGG